MIEELLAKIDDIYTIRILEEMIKIKSVVKDEKELAEYLKYELDAIGMNTEFHEVEPGRPNIYAKMKGKNRGRRLNFNGHTDTVPVVEGWDSDPFKPLKKGDRLYGLGSNDMKAGIACALTALRAFADSGTAFNGELSFAGVIDEEAFGAGAKAMMKTDYSKVDAIILGEPHSGKGKDSIPLGITGKILYDITVHGKAAHGFNPEEGINAIEEAGLILTNLSKLKFRKHPQFGIGNYSTLKIEGGYQIYSVIVPEFCRLEVNRLLVPGETAESAIEDMKRMVDSLKIESSVDVKIKPPKYEPYEISMEEPIIRVFDGVYREVMGYPPDYNYPKSITDANIYTGEGGIPCLHLGPKSGEASINGGNSHQKNEYVELSWCKPVCKMYALIASRFLGGLT